MRKERRLAIVWSGRKWFVRRIALVRYDDSRGPGRDEMIYHCDAPIANDLATAEEAVAAAKKWLARKPAVVRPR